jgi:AraC-like DNA-binding protein
MFNKRTTYVDIFSPPYCILFIWLFFLLVITPLPCQPQQDDYLTPERLIKNIQTQSFYGKKIDFIFSNAGIDEMIDYLEHISGFNFDLDPRIKIRATYHMQQVPWDQALAAILTDNKLNIDLGNDSIKIYTGQKYVLAFSSQNKAKMLIFLYRHFYMILFSLTVLVAAFIGLILLKKSRTKRNRIQRKDLLEQELAEEIEKRLSYLFEIEKIYRNDKLSLVALAEKLKITPHQLSWVINEKINKSFPSLVNLYRVEEVKNKLSQSNQNEITILQAAFEAGFSTKTSFNRAFKKITGLTPSQYREKNMCRDSFISRPG